MDEMDRIIVCKHCGKLEYYGEMRWLNGVCSCRRCYRHHWEELNKRVYEWNDLDKRPFPTMEEYEAQKAEQEQ